VGHHFGYSKDYILMLVKQGKIDGKKVGHKWYAHIPSAESYFTTAKQAHEAHRKQISVERKEELQKHTRIRSTSHHTTALVETLVIMVMGLSLGVTGYLGTTTNTDNQSYLASIARALYTTLTPETASVTLSTQTSLEQSAISAHVGTTTHTSLIIAPDELFTATTVESIQDSFFDPVTVTPDPTNQDTGIITPQFKNTEGEAYRFLMVPVTTN